MSETRNTRSNSSNIVPPPIDFSRVDPSKLTADERIAFREYLESGNASHPNALDQLTKLNKIEKYANKKTNEEKTEVSKVSKHQQEQQRQQELQRQREEQIIMEQQAEQMRQQEERLEQQRRELEQFRQQAEQMRQQEEQLAQQQRQLDQLLQQTRNQLPQPRQEILVGQHIPQNQVGAVPNNMNIQLPNPPVNVIMPSSIKYALEAVPYFNGQNIPLSHFIEGCKEALAMIAPENENNLLLMLRNKLRGEARRTIQGTTFNSLNSFLSYLKELYEPPKSLYQLQGEMGRVFQKDDESALSYTNRVRELGNKILSLLQSQMPNNTPLTPAERLRYGNEFRDCFIQGLKPEIEQKIDATANFSDVLLDAVKIEKEIRAKELLRGKMSSRRDINHSVPTFEYDLPKRVAYVENHSVICQLCNSEGHSGRDCSWFDHDKMFARKVNQGNGNPNRTYLANNRNSNNFKNPDANNGNQLSHPGRSNGNNNNNNNSYRNNYSNNNSNQGPYGYRQNNNPNSHNNRYNHTSNRGNREFYTERLNQNDRPNNNNNNNQFPYRNNNSNNNNYQVPYRNNNNYQKPFGNQSNNNYNPRNNNANGINNNRNRETYDKLNYEQVRSSDNQTPREPICYYCKMPGHFMVDCPKRREINNCGRDLDAQPGPSNYTRNNNIDSGNGQSLLRQGAARESEGQQRPVLQVIAENPNEEMIEDMYEWQ